MSIYNESHCADLTAAEALKEMEKERREAYIDKRAKKAFKRVGADDRFGRF